MNPAHVEVGTSDFAIGKAPQILSTSGIGSCIAICLYDRVKRAGALLHIMLPRSEGSGLNPLRFADTALSVVIEKLQNEGIDATDLTAKIVGGAQMFKAFASDESVGNRNSEEVERLFQTVGIPIGGRDLGGTVGRSLDFNLSTGQVTIYTQNAQ